jgi:hypothetical protein
MIPHVFKVVAVKIVLSSTIPQMEMKISQKTHVRVFYINSWG